MTRIEAARHRDMLIICSLAVAFAFLLKVHPGERVVFGLLPQVALPPVCASREIFGAACPGCGLTRSFVHLAHGEWHAAWSMHRLGWLMAVAVLSQFPYRGLALWRGRPYPLGRTIPRIFSVTLIALLIGNWLVGLIW